KNCPCWSISRFSNLFTSSSRVSSILGAVNFISTIINIKPIYFTSVCFFILIIKFIFVFPLLPMFKLQGHNSY
ncbi:hypothetical protein L9F63_002143, partial [Diploptera punctata]